jgi:pyruvate,water dikinase
VTQLTEIGLKVESHFGVPQDIEWAYARGRWYVLQARPITTLKAPAEPAGHELADQSIEYNRTMFIEIFPDPLSPVFLSVIGPLFRSMLDFTFETWGFKPARDQEAVGVFYNQPYFSRNYVEETLSPLSPKVRQSLVAQIVNPFGSHRKRAAFEWSLPYLRMALATLRFMVRFPKKLPEELKRYQAEVRKVDDFPTEGASDNEIVSELRRLGFDSARRLLDYDFLMIAIIGQTYRLLGSLLERAYGQDTDEIVARLISGVTGNITMETNKRIWDLAQVAKASPAVSHALVQSEAAEARLHLSKMPEAQPFLEALDRFLVEFGHREIRMDIFYPTWKEDPAPVFGFVRSYLDADERQSPYFQQERLVRERQELTSEVLDRLSHGLTGRLVISPLFRWVLAQAQEHTRERDTMHFELTRLFPSFRRLLAELGRRWSKRGFIASPDDVYFLQLAELEELAESPRSFIKLTRERRAEFEVNQARPWPDIIRDREEIYLRNGASEGVGESLQGVAGSPGLVSGISRVIRGPDEFDRLKKGDILVAPLTNPVWTPMFAVAGGLITEVGGILSHGAIVAREYGIPAVMSVPGATRRIPDGQAITVDGNTGKVFLQTQQAG